MIILFLKVFKRLGTPQFDLRKALQGRIPGAKAFVLELFGIL
jgi:hypothetical protein